MFRLDNLLSGVGPEWRYGILCGGASIPFAIGLYVLPGTGNTLSLWPVFVAGVLAGYLTRRDSTTTAPQDAGINAGFVGGLAVLWLSVEMLFFSRDLYESAGFQAVGAIFAILFVVVGLLVGAVVGLLGGVAGKWIAENTGSRPQQSVRP